MSETWIANGGGSVHLTRSADLSSNVGLCEDKVRIGDENRIDIVGYGTLTVVFPGQLTVNMLDVADVLDIAFNLCSLMAAHKHGARFTSGEESLCICFFR